MPQKLTTEEIAIFCKKKGFIFQNSEIYGGFSGFYDYGPLGIELKNNIKLEWWKTFVQQRDDIVGLDGSIITHPQVWKASGHLDSFQDIMIECKKCKERLRADQFIEEQLKIRADTLPLDQINKIIKEKNLKCPICNTQLPEAHKFNLMFKTNVGPVQADSSISYLRPETAQLIFINFKSILETSRQKIPFGIAQIGKAFRNEIGPRDFLFRTREFEQMEIEYFINPKDKKCHLLKNKNLKLNVLTADAQRKHKGTQFLSLKQIIDKKLIDEWHAYWLLEQYKWFINLGIKKENIRIREHLKEELSHYAKATFDIEYNFPFGWKEIHGSANRQDYDLKQHQHFSKKNLEYFDEKTKTRFIPHVIEPSQGVDRAFLAFLIDAYEYDKKRGNIVLHLHPKLAPIKVAIFPLVSNKKPIVKKAKEIYNLLKEDLTCMYDEAGSIGRRYARQDEIGTSVAVTIDHKTLKDNAVTIRDRETTKQIRVKIKDLKEKLNSFLKGGKIEKLGKVVYSP